MTARRLGGIGAARVAAAARQSRNADTIYASAAAALGLYHVAFYGERGTRQDRRRLADAWRESRRIAGGAA